MRAVKNLILLRNRKAVDDTGILGYLLSDSYQVCCTFELPYLDNEPFKSSIPVGTYKCKVKYSKAKGRVIQVLNVPNRDDILIHVGNTAEDTQGCILVGTQHSDNGVLKSRFAMGQLLLNVPNSFDLTIMELK